MGETSSKDRRYAGEKPRSVEESIWECLREWNTARRSVETDFSDDASKVRKNPDFFAETYPFHSATTLSTKTETLLESSTKRLERQARESELLGN